MTDNIYTKKNQAAFRLRRGAFPQWRNACRHSSRVPERVARPENREGRHQKKSHQRIKIAGRFNWQRGSGSGSVLRLTSAASYSGVRLTSAASLWRSRYGLGVVGWSLIPWAIVVISVVRRVDGTVGVTWGVSVARSVGVTWGVSVARSVGVA